MEAFKQSEVLESGPPENETGIERRNRWLNAYSYIGTIHGACRATSIVRARVYDWINNDPYFVAAMQKAGERSVDVLEEEARRRAYEGWEEDVYYKGAVVGQQRRFSDLLLMFTLKARAPEKYRERVDNRHSLGDGAQPDNALSEAEALRIRAAYLGALPEGQQPTQGGASRSEQGAAVPSIIEGGGEPVGPS